MMNKLVSMQEALEKIRSQDTIMVAGFTNFGAPNNIINALRETNLRGLTTISEDLGWSNERFNQGISEWLSAGMVRKVITSFLGANRIANEKIASGELEVELVPQGTLAERIRAGGAGLGGFYTPTGAGTVVEEGKETRIIDGRKYIFEKPLRANVALLKAHTADTMGNAVLRYAAMNFNPCMAAAADIVILEAENIVEPGALEPDHIHIPGVFVDYVVHCERVDF